MVQATHQSTEPVGAEVDGPPAPTGWRYHMAFHGTGGGLFGLILKNVLLTLLTLGVYAAWATTARRKYLWQNVEFHGQRLVYHGTGRELFLGYLKLIAGYVVFLVVPALLRRVSPTLGVVVQGAMLVGLLGLMPFALYWSRAYLLSRTTWRGIRFSMEPGAGPFARTFLVGYLLTILTLGLYGPVWLNRIRRVSIERSRFGSRAFRYDGSDLDVWQISIKGLLLSVLTLGIYYFWYIAELSRYEMQHTYFDGARGRLDVSGADMLKLTLLYLFGTTLTLGLAFPWLATYALRFMFERLSFEGPIDFAAIVQVEARGNAAGDGLADVLDLGLPLSSAAASVEPEPAYAGAGEFMDGRSALVHVVRVEVAPPSLRITGAPDAPLIEWPLSSVTLDETQEDIAHVHSALHPLALLCIRDAALVAALRGCSGQLRRLPGGRRRVPFAVACAAAIAVLGGSFYASVPGLSRWVAQRIPLDYERELGAGIAPLLARDYCDTEASTQALAELARRLDPAGPGAVELHVMRSDMVNAFALPGGTVVLTSALIEGAETPDSIAGVLAHELAHVEERHVMSHMVRASLLSAAWSVAVGDYAGLMLLDPSTAFEIVNLRHSRADEAEADRGAARRLDAAGISRRGLIDFFGQLREKTDWVPEWLSNHPTSAHRAAELASGAPAGGSPALTPESFEALRAACQ